LGSWVKLFCDGTKEFGSDFLIRCKKASWSRGRLTDIQSVFVEEGGVASCLTVPNTEWHQFDRYLVILESSGKQRSTLFAKVIQAKVTEEHVGKYISSSKIDSVVYFSVEEKKSGIMITSEDVDKWLTVAIKNKSINVFLGSKGQFDN
jgi:putative ribosome biogenesis GTPase RsgA